MDDEIGSAQEELASRQKAFIPINIITVILSLIASLSLLFAPIFTLDYAKLLSMAAENEESARNFSIKNSSVAADGETDGNGEDEIADIDKTVLQYIAKHNDFKISLTPLTFMRGATSNDPIKIIFGDLFKKGGMLESLMLNSFVLGASISYVLGSEFSEKDLNRIPTDNLVKAIRLAETDEQAAKAAFTAEIKKTAQDFDVQWDAEKDAELSDGFDGFISEAKGDSQQFTVERMVCRLAGGEGCTDYDMLANNMFGELPLSDPETQSALKIFMGALFVLAAFPALMWFILAVSAGTHILRKNKIFLTWYVKIFGLLPCLLFGVLPLLIGASVGGKTSFALSAIGTTAWISGACFLVFSLVSLFWLYPARSTIRRLLNAV